MATTDIAIKKAKPKEKQYRIYDEKGLYCVITPSGGKLWRLKYRVNGREKTLSIGKYPEKTLSEAIKQGGTTLKDFKNTEGKPGYFSQSLLVYGRKGKLCQTCQTPIESMMIAQRNSFFCPQCQKL